MVLPGGEGEGTEGGRDRGQGAREVTLQSVTEHSGLPWWLSGKEFTCNAGVTGDTGSIPGSGKSTGGRNGNPLQYSRLENPMDKEAWWATGGSMGLQSQTQMKQLSMHHALTGHSKGEQSGGK